MSILRKFCWQPQSFLLAQSFCRLVDVRGPMKIRSRLHRSRPRKWFIPRADNRFDYYYAYKAMNFSLAAVLTLVAFTWPVIAVCLDKKPLRGRYFWIRHLIDLLLCGWTFYWGIYLTLGRWLYGAYVAMAAIAALACTALIFLFESIRKLFVQSHFWKY
jgi:hypothetical protein